MKYKRTISPQLAIASAFSAFALAAVALLAPGSARLSNGYEKGAAIEITTPPVSVSLSLID